MLMKQKLRVGSELAQSSNTESTHQAKPSSRRPMAEEFPIDVDNFPIKTS